jgi:outer membrane protein TolC
MAKIWAAAVCTFVLVMLSLGSGSLSAQPASPAIVTEPGDKLLPINLGSALQLAGVRPVDIDVAVQRMRLAGADLERANSLWLPTILLGVDYFRHDGQYQDAAGNVLTGSKTSFMVGGMPTAVFAISDAIFAPLAARQVVRAREASLQAAKNDSLLAVAEAYFTVQQAVGDLAAAADVQARARDLVRRTEPLVAFTSPVEVVRAKTEYDRRRQTFASARERWQIASADLARILRLDAAALLQPLEPAHLQVTLLAPGPSVDDLIPVALLNRPELAAQQALVRATLERIKQERLRPLIPSVVLRGASTNPAGTLGGGLFGGGLDGSMNNFNARSDIDVQLLWELQNLGLGNCAKVKERRAENQLAILELFRLQDRIAAEVVQAEAQTASSRSRVTLAESELKNALESYNKNLEGMAQTKTSGNLVLLVIRPQEVLASLQALAQAYQDYYGAIADYNRAQFRLYHALGHPANLVPRDAVPCDEPASVRPVLGRPTAVQ